MLPRLDDEEVKKSKSQKVEKRKPNGNILFIIRHFAFII